MPTGRKKGVINNPDRYNEDGSYNSVPLDKEYFKHYYHQVIKKPYTCEFCKMTLASVQKINRHYNSKFCQLVKKSIEDPVLKKNIRQSLGSKLTKTKLF